MTLWAAINHLWRDSNGGFAKPFIEITALMPECVLRITTCAKIFLRWTVLKSEAYYRILLRRYCPVPSRGAIYIFLVTGGFDITENGSTVYEKLIPLCRAQFPSVLSYPPALCSLCVLRYPQTLSCIILNEMTLTGRSLPNYGRSLTYIPYPTITTRSDWRVRVLVTWVTSYWWLFTRSAG